MPIKNLLQRFQPTQLYIILVLSICYFSVQLVLSHITHALTLLMASYHMLCNIIALAGCIITIKHSKRKTDVLDQSHLTISEGNSTPKQDGHDKTVVVSIGNEDQSIMKSERRAMKLRNTFGWTRIDVLTMLIVCIILASLSFSLLVEALQTLVHIDHQDTMHLPIPVLILGFSGLILNGLTYLLIGGYTMHQGSFLHITPSGNVVLDRAMSNSGELTLKLDERQLSKTRNDQNLKDELEKEIGRVHSTPKRQGAIEMLRDISSTVFVIVCALIVYMAEDEDHTAKFIDPIISIMSCVLLVTLSYPYMKESCLILLQTIPGSINIESFERNLVAKFPEIVNYHDLHIWQLSAQRYVATIHIKFQNPKLYTKVIEDVRNYFHEQGINEITIQPEFHHSKSTPSLECLVQCSAPECAEKVCCKDSRSDLREISISGSSTKLNFLKTSLESLRLTKELRVKQLSVSQEISEIENDQKSEIQSTNETRKKSSLDLVKEGEGEHKDEEFESKTELDLTTEQQTNDCDEMKKSVVSKKEEESKEKSQENKEESIAQIEQSKSHQDEEPSTKDVSGEKNSNSTNDQTKEDLQDTSHNLEQGESPNENDSQTPDPNAEESSVPPKD